MISSTNQLDPYFTNIIQSLMTIEYQSLYRLEEKKDTVTLQRTTFLDMRTKLDSLQSLAQKLTSTNAFSVLSAGRSVSVSSTDGEKTVVSGSATSKAIVGDYEVVVSTLAEAQRRASAQQTTIDQALGYTGTFWLGGTGTAGVGPVSNASVNAVATAAVSDGLRELGTNNYTLEVRDNEGTIQFRLRDVDGRGVSIADIDGAAGDVTTSWQDVSAGVYDTGRGLTIDFTGDGAITSTTIDYTAAGVGVSVAAGDSLLDIAETINDADQPEGRDVTASVVGKQLVLTAANSGTAHQMIYSDGLDNGGLGFTLTDLQAARNASFTVNDIAFTRSSNRNLTDVVNGVTLNLTPDAEGETAILNVAADSSNIRSTIDSFLTEFNNLMTYIEEKSKITIGGDNSSYKRGVLASDTIFSDLRSNLFGSLVSETAVSGAYKSLRQIGIGLTENLSLTISDSARLEDVLNENLDDVSALFDQVMGQVDAHLERFTAVGTGYLDTRVTSTDSALRTLGTDIVRMEETLDDREGFLVLQYSKLQAELASLSYLQQQFKSIYG